MNMCPLSVTPQGTPLHQELSNARPEKKAARGNHQNDHQGVERAGPDESGRTAQNQVTLGAEGAGCGRGCSRVGEALPFPHRVRSCLLLCWGHRQDDGHEGTDQRPVSRHPQGRPDGCSYPTDRRDREGQERDGRTRKAMGGVRPPQAGVPAGATRPARRRRPGPPGARRATARPRPRLPRSGGSARYARPPAARRWRPGRGG